MPQAKKTLYEILGVPHDAEPQDIGLAYERKTYELQRGEHDPSAAALAREAYEVLGNPKRRVAYDQSLVTLAEKSAAAQQTEPDLVVEEDEGRRKIPWIPIAVGAVVVLAALFLALRPGTRPPPAAPVAEAPPPPPPPKPKSGPEVLADATSSGGLLLSYEMSGRAVPIGIALSVEPGMMVTTCHGIPAGAKLVVKVGKDTYPADPLITDENLDLCKLAVAGFGVPPLKVASEDAKAGDRIFAVGANATGDFALTEGTVRQVRSVPTGKLLEVSMPIAPTASGGGIFDSDGRLVGIATTPHKFGAGLNVAIPVSWLGEMRSRGQGQAQ